MTYFPFSQINSLSREPTCWGKGALLDKVVGYGCSPYRNQDSISKLLLVESAKRKYIYFFSLRGEARARKAERFRVENRVNNNRTYVRENFR